MAERIKLPESCRKVACDSKLPLSMPASSASVQTLPGNCPQICWVRPTVGQFVMRQFWQMWAEFLADVERVRPKFGQTFDQHWPMFAKVGQTLTTVVRCWTTFGPIGLELAEVVQMSPKFGQHRPRLVWPKLGQISVPATYLCLTTV